MKSFWLDPRKLHRLCVGPVSLESIQRVGHTSWRHLDQRVSAILVLFFKVIHSPDRLLLQFFLLSFCRVPDDQVVKVLAILGLCGLNAIHHWLVTWSLLDVLVGFISDSALCIRLRLIFSVKFFDI